MGLGSRIREAAGAIGGLTALADSLDMSRNAVSSYANDKSSPTIDVLERMAEATGKSLGWLVLGSTGAALSKNADVISIPRYAVQASAGDGAVVIAEDIADYLIVSRDWLSTIAPAGARLGIIAARGDSMYDTIDDGDLLIINFDVSRQDLTAGGVFVFTYEGDMYLKRLAVNMDDGSIKVISDNTRYPEQTIGRDVADEKLHVHAKVLRSIAPLRQGR